MLKTALLTIGYCAFGSSAFAIETPKYDRKIERAAMIQVARKIGGLRATFDVETKVAAADRPALPLNLDPTPTATVMVHPNAPRFANQAQFKNFTIIAGEYDR